MKGLGKVMSALAIAGISAAAGTYMVDNHRCKQVNYELAGYELPETWLMSSKQCLEAAGSVRMRHYARHLR